MLNAPEIILYSNARLVEMVLYGVAQGMKGYDMIYQGAEKG